MLRAAWRVKAGLLTKDEMDAHDRSVRERGARRLIEIRVEDHRGWNDRAPICQHSIGRWRADALRSFGDDVAAAVDEALSAIDGVVCCDDEPHKCSLMDLDPIHF